VAFWCIVLGAALIFASPRHLSAAQLALLAAAAVVVAAYAIVLHEQLAERPWFARSVPHPIWSEAAEILGEPLRPAVSIVRHQPFLALGAPLTAGLALMGSFVVCSDRERARQLLKVVAWSAAFYAAFAIVSFLIDPTRILWHDKQAYRTVLTGTFINRNTAAVYFGMGAIVWLLLLCHALRRYVPDTPRYWKTLAERLVSEGSRGINTPLLMLLTCLGAMFLTGSRAGVVLSLLALVIAFVLFFHRHLTSRRRWLVAVLIGAALALMLLHILGAGVTGRFDAEALADGGRFATYRSTWAMISDHPWLGTGLGTFDWSFPAYRSGGASLWGVWDRAHNTLLELAAEGGIPLAGLIVLGWILVLSLLIRGVRTRHRDLAVPVAALACAGLALVHSLIDFSLQIPGFAIPLLALVGAGIAQSFPADGRGGERTSPIQAG
jgi:O-antigen ligase